MTKLLCIRGAYRSARPSRLLDAVPALHRRQSVQLLQIVLDRIVVQL